MGLDIWQTNQEDKDLNYTYNVSPMWYEAYPQDLEPNRGMVYIDGMTGEEAYHKVKFAFVYIIDHYDEMVELEPENGWGSVEGFLGFLTKVMIECKRNPTGVWESWR